MLHFKVCDSTFQVPGDFVFKVSTQRNLNMSVEKIGGYTFRYCHDVATPGAVRVYVEGRPAGANEHLIPGTGTAPPHICLKEEAKPTSASAAQAIARDFVTCSENARAGRGFRK
jgi:hypothetical protein